MHRRNDQMVWGILGLLVLLGISFFRQLSLQLWPGDPLRPYWVFAGYLMLLLGWIRSIAGRVSQKNMRVCLLGEAWVMVFWMTVRFVQDAFLSRNLALLRFSGYLIHVPLIAIPLLGFFAACSLGRGDDYRFNPRWYFLAVPAACLLVLVLTDPVHHFVYRVEAGEIQPNVIFHPGPGLYLVGLWAMTLMLMRVLMIFRRNRMAVRDSALRRWAPLLEVGAMAVFSLPYVLQSFYVRWELVEFSAGIFFIEAASWELYVFMGLVPVNSQHELVFHRSTLGMQILDPEGRLLTRGVNAIPVTQELFSRLKQEEMVLCDGQEIHMHPIEDGYMVWQKDVSQLHDIISRLNETAANLREERELLGQELRSKSEKAAVQEQNRIYNRLTEEVEPQLQMLRNLLKKKEVSSGNPQVFQRICLIGTYIKQRCNLRLIEQAEHVIRLEDLDHGFRDLIQNMHAAGIEAEVRWGSAALAGPGFALSVYDVFWMILEQNGFEVRQLQGELKSPGKFLISVIPEKNTEYIPVEELKTRCARGVCLDGFPTGQGWGVRLWEEEYEKE